LIEAAVQLIVVGCSFVVTRWLVPRWSIRQT
jgi:hypothetical protein